MCQPGAFGNLGQGSSATSQRAEAHQVHSLDRTTYQAVLQSLDASEGTKRKLQYLFHSLNPISLTRDLDLRLEAVWPWPWVAILDERTNALRWHFPDERKRPKTSIRPPGT